MAVSRLLNTLIDSLPIELHLPGYNYCGPGTKLLYRLARGDRGIDQLDEHCKEHDLAYHRSSILSDRHEADKILMKMSRKRITASDASLREKIAAHVVNKAMIAKIASGAGLKKKRKNVRPTIKTGSGVMKHFKKVVSLTKKHLLKLKPKCKKMAIDAAIAAAKEITSNLSETPKPPRIIPVPKTGGFLPLIPVFAGLSAVGSLAGGSAAIAKVIKDCKAAKEKFQELGHHDKLESLRIGRGLHLKPYKNGLGIYVTGSKN